MPRKGITVGGLDDRNNFDPDDVVVWTSNYGLATDGAAKPEVVAPSLWVVAPVTRWPRPSWPPGAG